jgi:hypothetical protein
MLLAEQGHEVTKWAAGHPDPIEGLHRGAELWQWINTGKQVQYVHAADVRRLRPSDVDVVIENIRASTWDRWHVNPATQAKRLGVPWVSMRDDFDGRSFDAIAQARAWGDHLGYLPAYLGDTTGGLWLAFKALTAGPGHHVLRQAACLAKLVEGELVVEAERDGADTPWDDPGTYGRDGGGVRVVYRGEEIREPFRGDRWRRTHLRHDRGRYVV